MHLIENMLKQTMGLDAASIGSSLIGQTVRLRMQIRGLTKLEDYQKYLQETPAELNELVEAVVVKETWFFRDKETFTALVRLVANEWQPAHPFGLLRLLSLPCSTGEEPYSMGMALLDAGLPSERFQIDAVDISSQALECARRALYRKNSFRGQARGYREQHFQAVEDGYLLNQSVRDQVRFEQGNVLDDGCLVESGIYDFIFCRSLLIYFDRPTQEKVLRKLERLMTKAGVLFVGPVELPLVVSQGFVSANIPMASACRKADSIPKPQTERRYRQRKPTSKSATPRPTTASAKPISLPRVTPHSATKPFPATGKKQSPKEDLEKAGRLADEGRLAEAAQICEDHIRIYGASAQAYYLLGLVRGAEGNDLQATDCYRKALYLEPNHYETLVQLATVTEKNGDPNGARLLHKRAQRAQEKT